jgi:hypothetical protein
VQHPSLHRVLGGEFPGFHGTMALCDSLGPWRRASFPSLGATRRCACGFAPDGPGHEAAGQGFVTGSPRPEVNVWRPSGPPKFPENPRVPMPYSPTPAGPTRQVVHRSRRGPRYVQNEGSHDNPYFGAPSHGLGTRCLRFVRCLATRDARLASRCQPLYGTGLVTRRILTKGFRPLSSPLPELTWRKDMQDCFQPIRS